MLRYQVENMKCGGCVTAVKSALESLVGVTSAEVSLEDKQAVIHGDVDATLVEQTLSEKGYPAKRVSDS